jgi:hypothetical protein
MTNRDLLKEAIADAKAVKETAIANAKAALEEAFAPRMKEMLAAKLSEMEDEDDEMLDEAEETFSMEEEEITEEENLSDSIVDEEEMMDEELDLDELLRELESMEEGEDEMKEELNEEDLINDPKGPTAHGNIAEEEEMEEGEIDLENMSEDDLKSFIESVISDMIEAGELEAGEDMEDEDEEIDLEIEDDEEMEEDETEELMAEVKKMKKEVEEAKKAKSRAEKELKEALSTISTIKSELNEVNLFNAKLLYTNKIFKAKNLTESQKVKVLTSFDKATSVKEAQLVFETLSEGFKEKKSPINESLLRGSASKPTGVAEKKPILEVNDQFARWQKLAGIKN